MKTCSSPLFAKPFGVAAALSSLILTGQPAFAQPVKSVWLSGGAASNGNVSGAAGFRVGWIGAEFGAVGGGSTVPEGTLNYQIPHNSFHQYGSYTSSSYGGDVLVFLDLDEKKRVSLYAGPGLYAQQTTDVIQSNATGWLYENGTSTSVKAAVSGGLRVAVSKNLELGAGYHSIRGVQGTIGWRF